MKRNQVHFLQFWHYPPFKVSPPEKLISTFFNFFPTSSGILPQIFHCPIHTAFLPCISLVACSFCTLPFPVALLLHLIFLQIHPLISLHFLNLLPSPICHFLPWIPSITPNTFLLLLLFFYLVSFPPPTLQLLLFWLVFLLFFSALLSILCTILFDWHLLLNVFSLRLAIVIWPHWWTLSLQLHMVQYIDPPISLPASLWTPGL